MIEFVITLVAFLLSIVLAQVAVGAVLMIWTHLPTRDDDGRIPVNLLWITFIISFGGIFLTLKTLL